MAMSWSRLDAGFTWYLRISRWLILGGAVLALVVMLGVNSYNIGLRTLGLRGITWHQEISILAAMWVYFAAYALIAKEQGYIKVTFLADRLPDRLQVMLLFVIKLAVLAFHVAVLSAALSTMQVVTFQRTPVLDLPEHLFYIPLAVGTIDILATEIILLVRAWATRAHAPETAKAALGL